MFASMSAVSFSETAAQIPCMMATAAPDPPGGLGGGIGQGRGPVEEDEEDEEPPPNPVSVLLAARCIAEPTASPTVSPIPLATASAATWPAGPSPRLSAPILAAPCPRSIPARCSARWAAPDSPDAGAPAVCAPISAVGIPSFASWNSSGSPPCSPPPGAGARCG